MPADGIGALSASNWKAQISIGGDFNGVTTTLAPLLFGIHPVGTNDFDNGIDFLAPPPHPNEHYPEAFFVNSNHTNPDTQNVIWDLRPYPSSETTGTTWTFTVRNNAPSAWTMSWSMVDLPSFWSEITLDDNSGNVFDMRTVSFETIPADTVKNYTLRVRVNANDPPTFDTIVDQTATAGATQNITLTNVGPGAADETSQIITFTATSDNPTLLPNPTVTLSGGVYTLTLAPTAGLTGTAGVTVTATDDGLSTSPNNNTTSKFFTVTVVAPNSPPVATAQTVATNEDTNVAITLVGTDAESTTLSYKILSLPVAGALYQTSDGATLGTQIASALATVTDSVHRVIYVPTANVNGSDSFTFVVNDGTSDSSAVTVTVNVAAVNDPPSFAAISNVTANEDTTPTAITLTSVSPGGGTDEAGQTVIFTASSSNTAIIGAPTIAGNVMTFPAPTANANGTVTITVTANDGQSANSTFQRTFTVTLTPVNDPPVPPTINATVTARLASTINLTATDVDGNTLTYAIVTPPTKGSLALVSGAQYTYTSNSGQSGADTFVFSVSDGTVTVQATASITISNFAPVAQAKTATTPEDTPVTITLTGTDQDTGQTLTFAIQNQPTNGTVTLTGASALFTPTLNFNGTATFTYTANDSVISSPAATVTITVTAVNDAPVATNATQSTVSGTPIALTLLATDVDSTTLTYSILTQPTNGTLAQTATTSAVTYTPTTGFVGTDSFTFRASDGSLNSNTATVTITVTNAAPVAVDLTRTTGRNAPLAITLQATDVNGDTLTYAIVAQSTNGAVTQTGTTSAVTYTPTAGFVGTDSFTYRASDGSLTSNVRTVTV
ncbi:MAG: Ig-like domain-containing protein, partial [Candidatus Poribacteria bacterium]|nr:Ig-like domain-containing protein [Candidatus Poribacteria bacterium]